MVTIESSDTKDEWLEEVMAQFNSEGQKTAAGNTIIISAKFPQS